MTHQKRDYESVYDDLEEWFFDRGYTGTQSKILARILVAEKIPHVTIDYEKVSQTGIKDLKKKR